LLVASSFAAALAAPAAAQPRSAKPRPFSCTMPTSERTQQAGCYIIALETLSSLPAAPLFWHIYSYPNLDAARRANEGGGTATAVESLGRAWLFNIAPAQWNPKHGKREALVGPLSVIPGKT